jgi:hypothetical protein
VTQEDDRKELKEALEELRRRIDIFGQCSQPLSKPKVLGLAAALLDLVEDIIEQLEFEEKRDQ